MDAKEFIFPGVILALVIVIAIGLLLTHPSQPPLVPTDIASSTDIGGSSSSTAAAPSSAPPSATGTPSSQAYGSITLELGQAAVFADGLSIRPMHVIEDSRCPADVECIQAGTVKLSFTAVMKGKTTAQTISIGQSVEVGGDTVTFDSVAPQKMKAGFPEPSAYRFTFTVTPG